MSSLPKDHDDIDASKAPLMDHIIELRSRLIKALLASVSTAQAERFAHHVLQLKTSEEIRSYLNSRLHEVSSALEVLGSA